MLETRPDLLVVSTESGKPGPSAPENPAGVAAITTAPQDLGRARLSADELRRRLTSGADLADVSPPFAAVVCDGPGEATAATDHLGLGLLYGYQGDGWAAISSSARRLAHLAGAGLDRDALGVYRLVGFHLGEATAFDRVQALPAGHRWRLTGGRLSAEPYTPYAPAEPIRAAEAVRRCAALLRANLERALEEFPEAVFQLSGGLDTRLLLAAIPPARRKGLRTVTLKSAGNADDEVAQRLAERYGMERAVIDLDDIGALSPEQIHDLVLTATLRGEQIFSPLQFAMIDWSEAEGERLLGPHPRIDGIGGEITRGIYYALQRPHPAVTPQLVERLARWRIFSRDAVDGAALDPAFAEASDKVALARLQETFAGYAGLDWLQATDAFWYTIRSHRGVGAVQTQAARRRAVLSPFMHPDFVAIAAGLPAADKRGSRFNASVIAELDPELATVPMDTGVRPDALTAARPIAAARTARDYAHRVSGKVRQRVHKRGVTASVPLTFTAGLLAHWRANPALLEPVAATGLLDQAWLERMLAGEHDAAPATASFLSLLLGATTPDEVEAGQ